MNRMNNEYSLLRENESITIGSIKIPDPLFEQMRLSPVVELRTSYETRIRRILDEYAQFPKVVLKENTLKLKKRLGDLRTRQAVEALDNNDHRLWIEEILHYYDRTYDYGMQQRDRMKTIPL